MNIFSLKIKLSTLNGNRIATKLKADKNFSNSAFRSESLGLFINAKQGIISSFFSFIDKQKLYQLSKPLFFCANFLISVFVNSSSVVKSKIKGCSGFNSRIFSIFFAVLPSLSF